MKYKTISLLAIFAAFIPLMSHADINLASSGVGQGTFELENSIPVDESCLTLQEIEDKVAEYPACVLSLSPATVISDISYQTGTINCGTEDVLANVIEEIGDCGAGGVLAGGGSLAGSTVAAFFTVAALIGASSNDDDETAVAEDDASTTDDTSTTTTGSTSTTSTSTPSSTGGDTPLSGQ